MQPDRLLDEEGMEILRALQDDARISFAELGRKVGLSAPAITDRIRKMEESGIIAGYHARVNSAKLGLPIRACVRLRVAREDFQRVIALAREIPEVRECHHVSGSDTFLLRVIAASEDHLERSIDPFRPFGEVNLCVILSTPVEKYSA
jgi:Lrp/AsnC family transcriptional regulator, leucine-responsive regulatory protein